MTLEDSIAALQAKEEIRELTARYCHAVVDGDAETIVSLFCPDGAFLAHTLAARGQQELRDFYSSGVGAKTHKPFVQNHVIDLIDSDHAEGRCSVEIRVLQDCEAYTQAGHYQDKYRKTENAWRFQERNYIRYHNVPWREGWSK